jgi:hypothetical protein
MILAISGLFYVGLLVLCAGSLAWAIVGGRQERRWVRGMVAVLSLLIGWVVLKKSGWLGELIRNPQNNSVMPAGHTPGKFQITGSNSR